MDTKTAYLTIAKSLQWNTTETNGRTALTNERARILLDWRDGEIVNGWVSYDARNSANDLGSGGDKLKYALLWLTWTDHAAALSALQLENSDRRREEERR
ncbi:hypothetical protein BKG82_27275 [Mycobacteroides chelonae]|uniref:Uncharacterized protein n=1 Tax=Mycobacteroides chelonae TaxID=1774 RepID=A0A1S1LGS5_MYCCH|nr:hypothetical protein [Mycobacteroides chelonae]OHU47355.1 hypothetical protein BKG82_27275 [Mycobacteroides chelonae]